MSAKDIAAKALEQGKGIVRLAPNWVPRSFCIPGRRIKLHPDDYYALGGERGGPLAGRPHDRVRYVGGDVPARQDDPFVDTTLEAGRQVDLDAATPELVRRYDATRRRHPLAEQADGLVESIEMEREALAPVRDAADLVIDTTELNVHQLKERVLNAFDSTSSSRLSPACWTTSSSSARASRRR